MTKRNRTASAKPEPFFFHFLVLSNNFFSGTILSKGWGEGIGGGGRSEGGDHRGAGGKVKVSFSGGDQFFSITNLFLGVLVSFPFYLSLYSLPRFGGF